MAAERPAQPEEHEPGRSPEAVLKGLTQQGVVFMVDYKLTESYRENEQNCAAVFAGDEIRRGECLKQLHTEFGADAIRFSEDDDGQMLWLLYRRKGDELVETHSTRIQFAEIGPRSVTMTVLGPAKGKRALFRDAQKVTLAVPDEYRLELQDPVYGHLVYDAKMGFLR